MSTGFSAPSSPFSSSSGAFSYPPTKTPMFGSSRPSLLGAPSISTSPASISPLFGAPCTHASKYPLFGAPNIPASSCLLSGAPNTPAPGVLSSPLFGAPKTPAHGASTSPVFGAPNTPAPGASDAPLFGEKRTPVSDTCSSPLFGASSTPAFGASSSQLFGASISPLFGSSNKPTFGASRSPLFNTFGTPYEVSNKSAFGASSKSNPLVVPNKPAFPSCSNPPFVTSTPFPLQQSNGHAFNAFGSPFGVSGTPPFGTFTGTTATGFDSSTKPAVRLCNSPFGGFGATSSSFHGCGQQYLSGGFTSWSPFWKDPVRLASFPPAVAYKPLYNYEDENNQHIVYMSISAVLAKDNINMSHDELRWIDYCQRNHKGAAFNNSAGVFQTKSTSAESDMISIKIEVPSRVVYVIRQLLLCLLILFLFFCISSNFYL